MVEKQVFNVRLLHYMGLKHNIVWTSQAKGLHPARLDSVNGKSRLLTG